MKKQKKFTGSFKELKGHVHATAVQGKWTSHHGGYKQYVTDDGAILNWWRTTGTVNFQGPSAEARRLERNFVAIMRMNAEDSN